MRQLGNLSTWLNHSAPQMSENWQNLYTWYFTTSKYRCSLTWTKTLFVPPIAFFSDEHVAQLGYTTFGSKAQICKTGNSCGKVLPGRKIFKFRNWGTRFPFLCYSGCPWFSISSLCTPCLQVLANTTTYGSRFHCSCSWIAVPWSNLVLRYYKW